MEYRHSFRLSSEEEASVRVITTKHAPEDHKFELKPLVGAIEDIFHHALFSSTMVSELSNLADKTDSCHGEKFELKEALRHTIHRLSWEITCKFSRFTNPHTTALALFELLESYSWEAKVVLVLAAFAMSYGDFWLTVKPIVENPLTKLVCFLKQRPCLLKTNEMLRSHFQALSFLVKSMLESTKCILQLKECSVEFQFQAQIPLVAYRIIKAVAACYSYNMALVEMGSDDTTLATEIPELTTYSKDVVEIQSYLRKQLDVFGYESFVQEINKEHEDIVKLIENFYASKDTMFLWSSSKNVDSVKLSKATLQVLKGHSVALLISDFDVNLQQFSVLIDTYNNIKHKYGKAFEVLWIPMVDQSVQWTEAHETTFTRLAISMPWYSFGHPTMLKMAFVRYIRESWNFQKKPILVILDNKGNVASTNALPLVMLWGSLSSRPFSNLLEPNLSQVTMTTDYKVKEDLAVASSSHSHCHRMVLPFTCENIGSLSYLVFYPVLAYMSMGMPSIPFLYVPSSCCNILLSIE
ncbi:protein SIEVE ELEMENT OCCLUSION B-like [Tasmannia lanceolata]|uniref:protein SIEVE ELEMENT OCCLUSION B-like n=1 Tax=Tasmannia lanceolata TaxID=3420 RepID=UPI0040641378